ncbi:MAG: hypothetical protein CNCCGFBP_02176 [Fimbriimonadaceae bacterium]|nr:hypothetical protein [Fimbriimonadaceae bacterium]
MFGVVEEVDVGEPQYLRGRGHVSVTCKHLASPSRGVHNQRPVSAIPIRRLFVLGILGQFDVLRSRVRIEVRIKRVLRYPTQEPGSGPLRSLEERRLIVPGPGVLATSRLADVAGQHQRQIHGPVTERRMEPVVDALADVNRDRPVLRIADIVGQPFDQLFRRRSDFRDGLQVVVSEIDLVKLPERLDLDLFP